MLLCPRVWYFDHRQNRATTFAIFCGLYFLSALSRCTQSNLIHAISQNCDAFFSTRYCILDFFPNHFLDAREKTLPKYGHNISYFHSLRIFVSKLHEHWWVSPFVTFVPEHCAIQCCSFFFFGVFRSFGL